MGCSILIVTPACRAPLREAGGGRPPPLHPRPRVREGDQGGVQAGARQDPRREGGRNLHQHSVRGTRKN